MSERSQQSGECRAGFLRIEMHLARLLENMHSSVTSASDFYYVSGTKRDTFLCSRDTLSHAGSMRALVPEHVALLVCCPSPVVCLTSPLVYTVFTRRLHRLFGAVIFITKSETAGCLPWRRPTTAVWNSGGCSPGPGWGSLGGAFWGDPSGPFGCFASVAATRDPSHRVKVAA